MNHGGEAAEQIVRMSLNGTEVALKLAGAGAKNLAVLLYAILKDQKQTSGKIRLESLIRSGKELKVFSVSEADLQTFSEEAKRYGILYAAIRNPSGSTDGLVDVMVKAEDASRINRIVERFKLATVDTASIKSDIEQARAEKDGEKTAPEKEQPQKPDSDQLLNDLLGEEPQEVTGEALEMPHPAPSESRGARGGTGPAREVRRSDTHRVARPVTSEEVTRTMKSPLSETTSRSSEMRERGTTDRAEKPSVRGELNEIRSARKEKEAAQKSEPAREEKPKSTSQKPPQHQQHHNMPTPKKSKGAMNRE